MPVRSIREAIDSHTRLLRDFDEQLKSAGSERTATSDLPIRAKAREVERLTARLELVQKARDETVARFDGEIAALTETVTNLKRELELDRKRIEDVTPRPPGGGGGTPVPPASLDTIAGIGTRRAEVLKEAGIADVTRLADTPPERIAELLRLSVDQAKEIVTEAKRLVRPPR